MFDHSLIIFIAIGQYKEIMGNQEIRGNIRHEFPTNFLYQQKINKKIEIPFKDARESLAI